MASLGELLTVREIAEILRVDQGTVIRWCREGRIDGAFQTPGQNWRIPSGWLARLTGSDQP